VQGKKYTGSEVKDFQARINSTIRQALFSRLLKEVADSAIKSGTPLPDSEVQERASLKMFDYLTRTGDLQYTQEQIDTYVNSGGVPRLDGTYTVFGEVTDGLDVVDRIAATTTNPSDRPVSDIRILKMKIVSR
jgi:peptidyl-prolyl cis-trans isomerase B (cyclophilin B)